MLHDGVDAFYLLIFSYKNSELLLSFLPHKSHIRHLLRPFIDKMASDKNCPIEAATRLFMIIIAYFLKLSNF